MKLGHSEGVVAEDRGNARNFNQQIADRNRNPALIDELERLNIWAEHFLWPTTFTGAAQDQPIPTSPSTNPAPPIINTST